MYRNDKAGIIHCSIGVGLKVKKLKKTSMRLSMTLKNQDLHPPKEFLSRQSP